MSEYRNVGEELARHAVSLEVCKAVFQTINSEAPELARELGFSGDVDERGNYTGPWIYDYGTLPELMIKLREAAGHADAMRRRVAIQAIGEAAAYSEILKPDAESFLIEQLSHQDAGSRLAAVYALGQIASNASQRVVDALAKQEFNDPSEDVVVAKLAVLRGFDPVMVSRAVPDLISMLVDTNRGSEVRVAVCELLHRLGGQAIEAIRELLKAAIETPKSRPPTIGHAAASAVASIDPNGERAVAVARRLEDLEKLRDALLAVGTPSERDLAGRLTSQIAVLKLGPPSGRQRMYFKDIDARIFGSKPGKPDTRRKNIESWMEKNILPAMQIDHGLYDVDVNAMRSLREQHSSGPEPETT